MNMRPKGPEDVPIKRIVKELPIVAMIYNLETGETVREEHLNYGDVEERKWLGKLSYWAYTNGMSIETMTKADYDKHEMKDK